MFQLGSHHVNFMETFGYLHLPGLLNDVINNIDDAFEKLISKHGGKNHDGRERFCMAPCINHCGYLCSLLDDPRIHGIATSLLGDEYQYWNSDGNYYVGDTGWHSDTLWPEPLRFYKMAIYLDTMTKDTGALRVIPGSHRFGDEYAEMIHDQISRSKELWGGMHGSQVPAVALETNPGDLVVFNHSTKHSAWGGNGRRRMFTLVFTGESTDADALKAFQQNVRQHGYTKREVFGVPDGPLLATATPDRLRHLQQLINHIPETV